jgi:hypothetical protein
MGVRGGGRRGRGPPEVPRIQVDTITPPCGAGPGPSAASHKLPAQRRPSAAAVRSGHPPSPAAAARPRRHQPTGRSSRETDGPAAPWNSAKRSDGGGGERSAQAAESAVALAQPVLGADQPARRDRVLQPRHARRTCQPCHTLHRLPRPPSAAAAAGGVAAEVRGGRGGARVEAPVVREAGRPASRYWCAMPEGPSARATTARASSPLTPEGPSTPPARHSKAPARHPRGIARPQHATRAA